MGFFPFFDPFVDKVYGAVGAHGFFPNFKLNQQFFKQSQ